MSDLHAIRQRDAQLTSSLPPMPTRDPDPFVTPTLRDMAIEGAHDRRDLLDAIDGVLALHMAIDWGVPGGKSCAHCQSRGGVSSGSISSAFWPCPTVRALGIEA